MNTPHRLRAAASGPVMQGSAGEVLTALADGTSVFAVGSSGGQVAVTVATTSADLDYNHGGPDGAAVRSFLVTLESSALFSIEWPTLPRVVILRLIQGAGGSFVPTFGPEVKFTQSTTPAWTTTAGHWDELAIDWDGSTATVSYGLNYGP